MCQGRRCIINMSYCSDQSEVLIISEKLHFDWNGKIVYVLLYVKFLLMAYHEKVFFFTVLIDSVT